VNTRNTKEERFCGGSFMTMDALKEEGLRDRRLFGKINQNGGSMKKYVNLMPPLSMAKG
jgi:hypothetical protein